MKHVSKKNTSACRQYVFFALFSLLAFSNGFTQAIAQTHFTTVWEGENGQNHMNIMVVSAILDEIPLGANDEIAVFSGLLCVGKATLTQTINSANNSTFVVIKASQSDGSANGFNDNDTIIFKIWDSRNQKEMLAKAVKYRNDLPSWITNGKFSPGTTAVVEIVSFTEYTQTIQFIKGTNLFSSYITPTNPNFSMVMKSLCTQGAVVNVLDELGNSFQYSASSGAWINNIGSLTKTEGYSINVNFNSTLQITGKLVALPINIPLKAGWNFISFPRTDLVNAMTVIQPLIDQKKLVKVQDERGYTIEKVRKVWKNSIGNFAPGKAYKVNVISECTLSISQSYIKSVVNTGQPLKTEYFSTNFEGNGSEHMNIHLAGLIESGFNVGDEFAAYDGAICVGSVKLTNEHLIQGVVSIVCSTALNLENQEGFIEGHPIQILSWNKTSGEKTTIQAEVIDGKMKFEKLASLELNLKSTSTAVINIEHSISFDVFPNPGKGMVTIQFDQIPEKECVIEILDLSGNSIVSRLVQGISEEFNLATQPAGLYIVKTKSKNQEIIKKLILKK